MLRPAPILAVVLLLTGIIMAGFGVMRSSDGWEWNDETTVPVDGKPHEVETMNRTVWLWTDRSDETPTCTATEYDGQELKVRAIGEDITRPGRSADHEAAWEVHSYADTVQVTCESTGDGEADVHAEPNPKIIILAGIDPWIVRGALVAFLGVLLLLGSVVVHRANERMAKAPGEGDVESRDD